MLIIITIISLILLQKELRKGDEEDIDGAPLEGEVDLSKLAREAQKEVSEAMQ